MSTTLTLRRALVVLLVAAAAAASAVVLASGRSAIPPAAAAPDPGVDGPEEPSSQEDQPEIGTAIKMVRNADGSITTYER
jgi:hypothetical protein